MTEQPYSRGQTWGALRKAWKAYKIAKARDDQVGMLKYADRIRSLQRELGVPLSRFPNLGIS